MHYKYLIDRTAALWFKCQWCLLCQPIGPACSKSNDNKSTTFSTTGWVGFSLQWSFVLAFVKPFKNPCMQVEKSIKGVCLLHWLQTKIKITVCMCWLLYCIFHTAYLIFYGIYTVLIFSLILLHTNQQLCMQLVFLTLQDECPYTYSGSSNNPALCSSVPSKSIHFRLISILYKKLLLKLINNIMLFHRFCPCLDNNHTM